MIREEIKRRAELYSALAEGKTIQILNMEGNWVDVEVKKLNYIPETLKFRIKPQSNYRPFKTREECWEEMHKHPDFGWIKVNVTCEYEQIVRIFDYCKTELSFNIANNDDDYTSKMMLNSYTFTDGTPFGVKTEDVWKDEQKN